MNSFLTNPCNPSNPWAAIFTLSSVPVFSAALCVSPRSLRFTFLLCADVVNRTSCHSGNYLIALKTSAITNATTTPTIKIMTPEMPTPIITPAEALTLPSALLSTRDRAFAEPTAPIPGHSCQTDRQLDNQTRCRVSFTVTIKPDQQDNEADHRHS